MKLRVRCTLYVEVELPPDRDPVFWIEENSCPGTGPVGAEVEAELQYGEVNSVCWSCNLQGRNEIVEVNGLPVRPAEPRA